MILTHPNRLRLLLGLLLPLILWGTIRVASAQVGGRSEAPAATPLAGISVEQAKQVLDVLNDPARRAAFAATLHAIVKVQSADTAQAGREGTQSSASSPPGAAPGPMAIPLQPDSLGAEVLASTANLLARIGEDVAHALNTVQSLPLLYGWAVVMVTNPFSRGLLVDLSWQLGLTLLGATVVAYGLRRAVRAPYEALAARASVAEEAIASDDLISEEEALSRAEEGDTEPLPEPRSGVTALEVVFRAGLVLGRYGLDLLPVLGIWAVGHLMVASGLAGSSVSCLVILTASDTYAVSMALIALLRAVLSPKLPTLRLLSIDDATAVYLMRWARRLVLIGALGYALGEVWLLLGLSDIAHASLKKAVALVLHLCLVIIVLQSRKQMRDWLRAPQGADGTVALIRNYVAACWHWVALFLIVAVWLVWAVEVPHGYKVLARYAALSTLLLVGGRVAVLALVGSLEHATRPGRTILGLGPVIDTRVRAYVPMMCGVIRLGISLICGLGLLQLYGLGTIDWLTGTVSGQRIMSSMGTILLTVILAFVVWELVNVGIQHHLAQLQREAQVAKSARLRTLLPLLRTTTLVVITIIAGLMVLSEIGINIAPLLAGAGILGVAIGFGSQKLVQDLITGIFLLLENAMQVGDAVTVSGLSGTVEALSVRTIRLRASDGSVHIIPFSAVTSVTNVNRGLGNAAVTVQVDFHEDTDRVCAELRDIIAGMREEATLSPLMLSDLQLWGVDKVDGGAVTIAGQVVCTDTGRLTVQREFNRRMKKRFQDIGIRVFNPARQIALPAEAALMHKRAD